MPWWLKPGSRGFTPAFITGSTLRRGRNSGARSRGLPVRSIGLEARPWRCDESDQAGCREASGPHEGPRRLLTASEPPRIAHEDQRAGEITAAVLAGLQVQHARLAVGAQSDRRTHSELAWSGRQRHAGVERNGVSRPAEASVAPTDEIANGLTVDPAA